MILFISSSNREAAALATACDHRSWASYSCATVREFRPLTERIRPRAIVVRQRLIDGYSDDIFVSLRATPAATRPRVIVLMSADRSTPAEARQIALGADCVLHDPVRMEILLEYLAKYRLPVETHAPHSSGRRVAFSVAGVDVYPQEHRIARGKRSLHVAPQEIALLRILADTPDEVVPYEILYGDLLGRRFEGDTTNCRVLLGKVSASFKRLQIDLRSFIQVIPKSGYLYSPVPDKPRLPGRSTRPKRLRRQSPIQGVARRANR